MRSGGGGFGVPGGARGTDRRGASLASCRSAVCGFLARSWVYPAHMPGPAPKPKGQRRHRNATPGYTQIDPTERTGPIPDWPLTRNALPEYQGLEEARWDELWRLPQSREWLRMKSFVPVALYVRLEVLVSTGMPDPRMISELRQLDATIGISPKAMQGLRWEIPQQHDELEQGEARPTLHSVDKKRTFAPAVG